MAQELAITSKTQIAVEYQVMQRLTNRSRLLGALAASPRFFA